MLKHKNINEKTAIYNSMIEIQFQCNLTYNFGYASLTPNSNLKYENLLMKYFQIFINNKLI